MTDWLMVIITAIYVIATIIICYFNGKSANAAKKQTEEMIRQYNEANRPHVTIHFDIIRSGLLCFIIENEGNKPAHDVSININEDFLSGIKDEKDKMRLRDLNNAKLYLSSGQKIYLCIGGQTEFQNISVNVAYFSISYDGFVEKTSIDLKQYGMFLVYSSPFEDIAQHLEKIKENDDKFYKKAVKHIESQNTIQNVIIHNETEDESNKYKIFKMICCENGQSANSLSDALKLNKEYVLELLIELQKVDELIRVGYSPKEEDDFSLKWYKR